MPKKGLTNIKLKQLQSSRAMSCRLAVAVNRYPLKWKSLERRRDLRVQGRPPRQRSGPTVVLHTYKKCNKEGEGWGTNVKKSSSTKCEERKRRKKENSWKGTRETVFLLISSTHQMANIILDDGHFAKERQKAGGREMKKGFMYLIIRWS